MKSLSKFLNFYLKILLIGAIAFSCQKKLEVKYAKAAEVYRDLVEIEDSLKAIEINFDLKEEKIAETISSLLEINECFNTLVFKLKLKNLIFPLKLSKRCPNDPIGALVLAITPEIVIRTNYKGQILYNGEVLTKISDLSHGIEKDLGVSIEDQRFRTNIRIQQKTPIDSIFETFNQIKIGYLKVYRREAKNKYNKHVGALSIQEINQLKMSIPYLINILLRSYEDNKLIPPPPARSE